MLYKQLFLESSLLYMLQNSFIQKSSQYDIIVEFLLTRIILEFVYEIYLF